MKLLEYLFGGRKCQTDEIEQRLMNGEEIIDETFYTKRPIELNDSYPPSGVYNCTIIGQGFIQDCTGGPTPFFGGNRIYSE